MYDLASPLLATAVRPPSGPVQPFQPSGSPDEPLLPPQSQFERRWGETRRSENVEHQSPLESVAANFRLLNGKTVDAARDLIHPERAAIKRLIEKLIEKHIGDPLAIRDWEQGATAKDSNLARDAGINDITDKRRPGEPTLEQEYARENPNYPKLDLGKLIEMLVSAITSGEIFEGMNSLKSRPPMQRAPQLPQQQLPADLTRGIMAGA